jgi:hypothetical protein
MGAWYWIGVLVGLGVAGGVSGASGRWPSVSLPVSVVIGVAIGLFWKGWPEAIGAGVGAVLGSYGAAPVVAGALRRGGDRLGTRLIVGAAALGLIGLAFVPVLGYVEALAVPALGLRLRSRAPDRHAGLRTLTKD